MTQARARTAILERRVVVQRPIDVVRRAVTDWDRQGEWMLATTVRATEPRLDELPAEVVAVTGAGKLGLVDRMIITGWEPPLRCEVLHVGRVLRGTGLVLLAPIDGTSCCLVWREELELPAGALGLLAWKLLCGPSGWGVRFSLRRFARWALTYPG
jgi:hypothetical protein